jgi:hypothetical protein
MLAYDPGYFLTQFEINHTKSHKPVDFMNFIDYYKIDSYQDDKPFFCYYSEIIPPQNKLSIKKPMALISAASYDANGPYHKRIAPMPSIFYPEHLLMTYKTNKIMDRIRPITIPQEKIFLADVLMGQPKIHRWQIVNRLIQHGFDTKCLISLKEGPYVSLEDSRWIKRFFPKWGYPKNIISDAIDEYDEPDISKLRSQDKFDSTAGIRISDHAVWVSRIIPTKIYDASWISLVAETDCDYGVFFPTEKVGKPLLDGRLFLAISCKDYLKKLRKLGFETFYEYIDESYDDYDRQEERVDKMIDTFIDLSKENMSLLYQKILPILEHNQMLARSIQKMTGELVSFLKGFETGIRYQPTP